MALPTPIKLAQEIASQYTANDHPAGPVTRSDAALEHPVSTLPLKWYRSCSSESCRHSLVFTWGCCFDWCDHQTTEPRNIYYPSTIQSYRQRANWSSRCFDPSLLVSKPSLNDHRLTRQLDIKKNSSGHSRSNKDHSQTQMAALATHLVQTLSLATHSSRALCSSCEVFCR